MDVLTLCVGLAAFVIGNIVTFRLFLGRGNRRKTTLALAFQSGVIGFAVTIGIVAAYMLIGHLIWRSFG
jgi:hypothetical protein